MNELISMPVIVEGEEYDYCEEESAAEVIGSLLAGVDGMEWKDDTLIKHTTSADVPIANFIPVPVEDIIYDNGAERSRFFRIKGLQSRNGKLVELPVVKVDSNDISNLNWVTAEWGFDAIIYPPTVTRKDTLRSVMFMIGQKEAVRKTIYTHTGWREENGNCFYLHAGGAIGNDNAEVCIDNRLERYNLSGEKHNFISVCDAVTDIMNISKPEVMYPLIATVFLCPLNEFFRRAGYEPLYLLFLVGRTQTRKSTLAALMLSFFGEFSASTLPCSFKDTANAIEKKGYILKDTLNVVDDYHPAMTSKERQTMDTIMQSLSRGYGDRKGRDRMNPDISLRESSAPRGNVIITGEDIPDIGQSGIARNFIVELTPDDVPLSEYLSRSQQYAQDGYYKQFMREYISWLIPQTEQLPQKLKSRFLHYRDKAIEENSAGFGRTGGAIAWMMTGFEYFLAFLQSSHMLNEEQMKIMIENAWKVFTKLASAQLDKSAEETPTKMFLEAVADLIETKKIHLQTVGGFPENNGEFTGYRDENNYYFIPSKIYAEVEKLFQQQSMSFPLSKNRIIRQLAVERISITNGNKNTYSKRIGKNTGKYLCIPKNFIDEIAA